MRSTLLCFSFILLSGIIASGQNDNVAVKILDKFSANALGAPSVFMKFDLVKSDQMENTTDTLKGSIILSKDKYRLDLKDNISWFNGETNWSYLIAEKEVTITKADKKDNSFQSRPSAIFSMYKKGYKCRLIEEKADSYIIDLYPDDIKNDLIRVRLCIGKSILDLRSFEYKRKDGIVISINVKDFNLQQKHEPGTFTFQAEKYKGVDVIDMR